MLPVVTVGLALAVTATATAGAATPRTASMAAASRPTRVIVQGDTSATPSAIAHVVRALGGTSTRPLPIVHGVAAVVPANAVPALRSTADVRAVTPDAAVHLSSIANDRDQAVAGTSAATSAATSDTGTLAAISRIVHARDAWLAGYTGKGVDIAMLDTGVAPVPGLTSGNVINGPDLSFDSQTPSLTDLDGYGHGTHMASILVGRDAPGTPASYANSAGFTGIAPDARVVSVKVGASDGSVDVSQVIAGIDWVTEHAQDGLNIRVLNLSFGTDSVQPYAIDPLAYAAEVAWRHGIVVVAAGGNDGTAVPTLSDPAIDPYVLAVGADDPHGTLDVADDTVPDFATRGTASRHVDVVAPAVHVLGLRDPLSAIDLANPQAVVGARFFRGSGTSQATAVVSGVAALLLQRYPYLSPDAVKRQLSNYADPFAGTSAVYRGSGVVDAFAAISAPPLSAVKAVGLYGTGLGSLDAARGSARVTDGSVELSGEQDIFGAPWRPAIWAAAALAGGTWSGGTWNSSSWSGAGWSGTSWTNQYGEPTWQNATWTAPTWAGGSWLSHTWTGHTWTGSSWDGHTWTDATWLSHTWTAATWASADWS